MSNGKVSVFFEGQRERGEAALEKNGKEAARKAVSLRQHILSYAKIGDIPHLEAALDHWLNSLEELEFHQLKKECVNLMALLDEGLTSKSELIVLEEEKIIIGLSGLPSTRRGAN